jgi:hypothetical protein
MAPIHPYCTQFSLNCGESPDSFNRGYTGRGEDTPSCCATHLVELLFAVADLLEREGIPYFIFWGTWLGAVRHGGLIPWDYDIDLGVPAAYRERVHGLKSELRAQGYYFMHKGVTWDTCLTICYGRINFLHVDIDFWDLDPADAIWQNSEWRQVRLANDDLFPLKRYPFHGRELWGPGRLTGLFERYGQDCLTRAERRYWSGGKQHTHPIRAESAFAAARIDLDARYPRLPLGPRRRLRQESVALRIRWVHQMHLTPIPGVRARVLGLGWRLFNGLLWVPRRVFPRPVRHGLWQLGQWIRGKTSRRSSADGRGQG